MENNIIYAHVPGEWKEVDPKEFEKQMRNIQAKPKKEDNGKSPVMQGVFQFFPRALLELGGLSAKGNEKYDWDGWKDLPDGEVRYGNALCRHILRESIQGPFDRESKHLHAAHAAWNAIARLELLLIERER